MAGMVAMAHFTIKTTIDENDIFMSVTTTSLVSFELMDYSFLRVMWLNFIAYLLLYYKTHDKTATPKTREIMPNSLYVLSDISFRYQSISSS